MIIDNLCKKINNYQLFLIYSSDNLTVYFGVFSPNLTNQNSKHKIFHDIRN